MRYKIDCIRLRENILTVAGWAVGDCLEDTVTFRVTDKAGKEIPFDAVYMNRFDITREIFNSNSDKMFGFDVRFEVEEDGKYILFFLCNKKQMKETLDIRRIKNQKNKKSLIRDCVRYFQEYGFTAFVSKVKNKLKERKIDYDKWRLLVIPGEEDLEAQRKHRFMRQPLFSIVVPLYRTNADFLREMIDSVKNQTYEKWQLCLADGSGEGFFLEDKVKEYGGGDKRIHYICLKENMGISENTNEALKMADGDYVVFLDHDDLLSPDALYECAAAVNRDESIDVIYSDEDKVDESSRHFSEPHFKPDFNPDLLCSVNYICHLFVVKQSLLQVTGGLRKEYDGAQDYDFVFRCTEQAQNIYHIPKVLYHWRISSTSTAENPEQKLYAFKAGARAITDHCRREGYEVTVAENMVPGYYKVKYRLKSEPLVSIIIPNKDHKEDLDKCIGSIMNRSSYRNIEVIIVENNSSSEEIFDYYKKLEEKYAQVKVVFWDQQFNYSAINNFGAGYAKGEYLLLLNNDTEIINPDCISELLGYCQREDTGIVGARLLYPDDTIQHAGVVVGFGGIAGHTFVGFHREEKSYFLRSSCTLDYSAVTAACMMVKKSVFEEIGGFYEGLAVAFNDIDFCLRVRQTGRLVVYHPGAELYHYESKSRGLEDTPEKIARFNEEIRMFKERWRDILEQGDPCYNPNLTLRDMNFALRDLEKEGIPFVKKV